jgi:hypothetical protein
LNAAIDDLFRQRKDGNEIIEEIACQEPAVVQPNALSKYHKLLAEDKLYWEFYVTEVIRVTGIDSLCGRIVQLQKRRVSAPFDHNPQAQPRGTTSGNWN